MRVFFGFILGVIVTIAAAYAYDSQTGRIDNGLAATESQAPMVNWKVVNDEWTTFQSNLRDKPEDLQKTLKRHIG